MTEPRKNQLFAFLILAIIVLVIAMQGFMEGLK